MRFKPTSRSEVIRLAELQQVHLGSFITSKQNILNITITGAEVIFTPQEIAQSARKIQIRETHSSSLRHREETLTETLAPLQFANLKIIP